MSALWRITTFDDLTGFVEVLSASLPNVGWTRVWYNPILGVLQIEANGSCSRIYIEHFKKLEMAVHEIMNKFTKTECPDCGFKFSSKSDWAVCPRCGSEFKIEIGGEKI